MIELVENKTVRNPRNKYRLLIEKKPVKAKIRSFTRDEELLLNISTTDFVSAKTICKYKFQDYPNLYYLSLPLNLPASYLIKVGITYNSSSKRYELRFRYSANTKIWKDRNNYLRFYGIYSNLIAELNYSKSDVAKQFRHNNLKPEINTISQKLGFEVSFSVYNLERSLSEEIEYYSIILNEYHLEALRTAVDSRNFKNSEFVETIFKFPLSIKVVCEQYLLYFAQFLQDLGINATSNLKEEAGKVLFSVTPTDGVEALDKIREALAVYLNLPSSPVVYDESIPSMRLKQQIDNLQHALKMSEMEYRLAQRVIESQDKIIQQKDSTIEQQSKILEKLTDKAVMINSAENKEELEELFEGVKIGKSKFLAEQGGLHLNPLTALKSVGKKITGKDDEIISLNLNGEIDLQD